MSYTAITHGQRLYLAMAFTGVMWFIAVVTSLLTTGKPFDFDSYIDIVAFVSLVTALLSTMYFAVMLHYNDWDN